MPFLASGDSVTLDKLIVNDPEEVESTLAPSSVFIPSDVIISRMDGSMEQEWLGSFGKHVGLLSNIFLDMGAHLEP